MNKQPEIDIIYESGTDTKADISVIITLYNYEKLVVETMESVKLQTFEKLNFVIVNDCSTDNSLNVVLEWAKNNASRFHSFKLLHHVKNQGLGITRNTAVSNANADFVFILDADNIIYPRCLEKLHKGLTRTDAAFAYSYLEHFGDTQKLGGINVWNPDMLHKGNTIDAMVLLRKSKWIEAGGYSEDMPANGWEDYELWFKIAKNGGWGLRIPEILGRYRVHISDSMLHSETNKNHEILKEYNKNKHPQFFINI